jgi:hypothetical protein
MGEAADRKVTEIQDTRRRLERDLHELEERLPAPMRSVKSVLSVLVGTAALGALLRRLVSRRPPRSPAAEIVVRVVREDG